MYRIISLFVITWFVSIMLYLHQQNSHFGSEDHVNHMEEHESFDVSSIKGAKIPEVDGWIKQDTTGSWMLKIQTKNFTFNPEKLGSNEPEINEGHAHLYINGEKKTRIYGNYYDMGKLKSGIYNVKVTLTTNNHKQLVVNGKEISFNYKLHVQ